MPTDFIVVRDGTTVATFYDGGGDAQLEVAAARARHDLGHRPRSESALWRRHPEGGRSPYT